MRSRPQPMDLGQLPLDALGATLAQRDAAGLLRLSWCSRSLHDGLLGSLQAAETASEQRLRESLGVTREELAGTDTVALPATLPEPQRHHLVEWLLPGRPLAHVARLTLDDTELDIPQLRGSDPDPTLELSYTNLGVVFGVVIGKLLKVNVTLTTVCLCENQIGSEGAAAIGTALMGNTTLKALYLDDNEIGDEGGAAIAEALRVNATLTKLGLTGTGIGDEGMAAIAEALYVNATLTILDMNNNYGTTRGGTAARRLANAALASKSLVEFSQVPIAQLRANTLTELDISEFRCGIMELTESMVVAGLMNISRKLRTLTFDGNVCSTDVFLALKRNTTLTELSMFGHDDGYLSGSGNVIRLADALTTNTTLTSLGMGRNRHIDDRGWVAIANALAQNRALTTLDLQQCRLCGNGPKPLVAIATAVAFNSTLTTLDLEDNEIGKEGNKEGVDAVIKALTFNDTLTCLSLVGNGIDHADARALARAGARPTLKLQL